jgi:hypothetical protein
MASRHNHVVFEVQVRILGRDLGFAYKVSDAYISFRGGRLFEYIYHKGSMRPRFQIWPHLLKYILEVNSIMKSICFVED